MWPSIRGVGEAGEGKTGANPVGADHLRRFRPPLDYEPEPFFTDAP
jgi:hypothetical protein